MNYILLYNRYYTKYEMAMVSYEDGDITTALTTFLELKDKLQKQIKNKRSSEDLLRKLTELLKLTKNRLKEIEKLNFNFKETYNIK